MRLPKSYDTFQMAVRALVKDEGAQELLLKLAIEVTLDVRDVERVRNGQARLDAKAGGA